jgi:hypothetical protein
VQLCILQRGVLFRKTRALLSVHLRLHYAYPRNPAGLMKQLHAHTRAGWEFSLIANHRRQFMAAKKKAAKKKEGLLFGDPAAKKKKQ